MKIRRVNGNGAVAVDAVVYANQILSDIAGKVWWLSLFTELVLHKISLKLI